MIKLQRFIQLYLCFMLLLLVAWPVYADYSVQDHRLVDRFLQSPTAENFKQMPWPTRMSLMINEIVYEDPPAPVISSFAQAALARLAPTERKDFYTALMYDIVRLPTKGEKIESVKSLPIEGQSYPPGDLLKKVVTEAFALDPAATNKALCFGTNGIEESLDLYLERSTLTEAEIRRVLEFETRLSNYEFILQQHGHNVTPSCPHSDGTSSSISTTISKFRGLVDEARKAHGALRKKNPEIINFKTDPTASKKCFSPGVEQAAREKFVYMETEKKVKRSASIGRVEGCGYYFELERSGHGYRARDFYSKAFAESETGIKVTGSEDLLNILRGARYEVKPGLHRVDKVIAPVKVETGKK